MEAASFNCPNCGAAAAHNASECQYCHTLLQTVACPKCMGMMFAGTKFCPHCGVAATKLGTALPADAVCPRCKNELKQIDVAGTSIEECMHCGGMWISVAAFDHICSDQIAQTAATGLQVPPEVPIDPDVRYIKCPQCGNLMNRRNYGGGSGIILNVCRAHGIWLDRDELRQIIDFIHIGGLERTRLRQEEQAQSQRRIAEMERSMPSSLDLYSTNAYGRSPGFYGLLLGALGKMFR